jgi:hypothetical protein
MATQTAKLMLMQAQHQQMQMQQAASSSSSRQARSSRWVVTMTGQKQWSCS